MIGRVGTDVVTLFKRGSTWWIRWSEDGAQRRESLRTDNKRLAAELRARREFELVEARQLARLRAASGWEPLRGGAVGAEAPDRGAAVPAPAAPAAAPRPALAEIRSEYSTWSRAHKRPKTILNDTGRLDAFFAKVVVDRLDAVHVADVERFLGGLAADGRTPATILRHREILHAFFRWALRMGYVDQNPVTETRRPRLPERDPRFLALDQVDELLGLVSGTSLEPVVATAVFGGLRREELCWLTWDDLLLDGDPAMLRVRAKTVAGESWEPKTKRDRRIPVGSRLRAVLTNHRSARGRGCAPWLFTAPKGGRWDPDNLSRALREVLKDSGLPWNFLDLRHTFGSQLARKGVSLVKIAKLMGNSPMIAQRHYINLIPEEMAVDVEF